MPYPFDYNPDLDNESFDLAAEPSTPYGANPLPQNRTSAIPERPRHEHKFNMLKFSYKRRAKWNDYTEPRFYHVILKKARNVAFFATIRQMSDQTSTDYNVTESHGPSIDYQLSEFGRKIQYILIKYKSLYRQISVDNFMIMPDHIHFIVNVKETYKPGLGAFVKEIKGACTRRFYWYRKEKNILPDDPKSQKIPVFETGFTDKILSNRNQLSNWNSYIADNPRRYLIKKQHPDLFTTGLRVTIKGREYAALGNIFLLESIEKAAVKISRKYTDEEKTALKEQWLRIADNGGVLISPFISREERDLRFEAIKRGASIIRIQNNPYRELEKPSAFEFEMCAAGRLLIITPVEYSEKYSRVTYVLAQAMNNFASHIAGLTSAPWRLLDRRARH